MRLLPPDPLAEARRILALAWPVMLTSLNWTLMHVIDVAIVGRAGTSELGALAAGRTLTYITIVMGLSAMSGVLVFSARADGAGRPQETGDYLRTGLLFGLLLGLPSMIALALWAEPMLRMLGVPAALAGEGGAVVRAMALAYPFQFVSVAASYFLEGVSSPRRVMVVNLATLPLNAVLAWAWVGGHWGLPARGAVGAVSATALVSLLGAAGMVAMAWTLPDAQARGVRDVSRAAWVRAARGLPAQLRFGLVPAIAAGLELGGFSWLIVLSTQLGAVTAAAFQTVFSLHNFAFSLAMGCGSAAGVRAGNAVGGGDPAAALPRALIAAGLAVLLMGALGLVYALAAPQIVRPFSDDPAVLALAATLMLGWAPFMAFDGVQLVGVYALRSLGDQVAAGVVGILAFFVVTAGLGSLLVAQGFGAYALIWASAAGMVTAAVLQIARLVQVSARAAGPSALGGTV